MTNPQATLDGVSDFIGAEHFEHWLTDLDQVEEDDSAWDEVWGGDKTLHQLKADVDSNTEFDTSMIPENMKLDSFWDAIL